jgi:hypothetical protein
MKIFHFPNFTKFVHNPISLCSRAPQSAISQLCSPKITPFCSNLPLREASSSVAADLEQFQAKTHIQSRQTQSNSKRRPTSSRGKPSAIPRPVQPRQTQRHSKTGAVMARHPAPFQEPSIQSRRGTQLHSKTHPLAAFTLLQAEPRPSRNRDQE